MLGGPSGWKFLRGFLMVRGHADVFAVFKDDRFFGLVILLMVTRNPARKPVEVGSLSHY